MFEQELRRRKTDPEQQSEQAPVQQDPGEDLYMEYFDRSGPDVETSHQPSARPSCPHQVAPQITMDAQQSLTG